MLYDMSTEKTELMQTPLLKIWVPGAGGSLGQRRGCECEPKIVLALFFFSSCVFGLSPLLL